MADSQEIKRVAEELIDGFRHMWAEHDHSSFNRQNLNKFLHKLLAGTDRLISVGWRERKGSYVIRQEVSGEIILLSDLGEIRFFNLDLARECKNILDDNYEILQIIEW